MNKFEYCIQAYSNPVYMSFEELSQLTVKERTARPLVKNKTFTVLKSALGPPPSRPPPSPPKTPPPPMRHKPKQRIYENVCMETESAVHGSISTSCCSSILSSSSSSSSSLTTSPLSSELLHIDCFERSPRTPCGRRAGLLKPTVSAEPSASGGSNLCSTLNTIEHAEVGNSSSDSSTATMIIRKSPPSSTYYYAKRMEKCDQCDMNAAAALANTSRFVLLERELWRADLSRNFI